jgi:hypothetical protein
MNPTTTLHPDTVLAISRETGRDLSVALNYMHELINHNGWRFVVAVDHQDPTHVQLTGDAANVLREKLHPTAMRRPLADPEQHPAAAETTDGGALVDGPTMSPALRALLEQEATAPAPPPVRYMAYAHQGLDRVFILVADESVEPRVYPLAFEFVGCNTIAGAGEGFPGNSAGHRLIERGWMPRRGDVLSHGGWTEELPGIIMSMPVDPIPAILKQLSPPIPSEA